MRSGTQTRILIRMLATAVVPAVEEEPLMERDGSSSVLPRETSSITSLSDLTDADSEQHRLSMSEKEQRLLSLENISLLRNQLEEIELEIEKQKQLTLKIEEKWKDSTMGAKMKELKKRSSGKGLQVQDLRSIRDEEKKLAEIRQVTYQRMSETTRKLEVRAEALRLELDEAKKRLHSTYKTLHAQPLNINQRRIETLLKKRPSIEDLVYRGIWIDPARRRSREVAQEVLSEMLKNRKRNSGSYSASWMFSPERQSFQEVHHKPSSQLAASASAPSISFSAEDEKRKREFQHLLQKERCLIDFQEITDQRLVAEGAFAHVNKGTWRGLSVAVKLMKPRENVLKICQAEVICLLLAKANPHVIKLVGACVEPPCIVTPFYESGSLYDGIHKRKMKYTLDKLLSISKEIAMGLAGLHALDPPLMHRDVSTNNILLDENGHPLIIDFGIAREDHSGISTAPHSPIGHPRLRAPEISNNKPYTKSVDVYNFGTVMFELATARLPHDELADAEAAYCTSRGLTPALPEHLPSRLRKLISQCWDFEPALRPPFKTILFELQRIQEELDAPMPLRKSSRSLSKGNISVL